MRIIIQRVSKAEVSINGKLYSAIAHGFLILLGVEEADCQEDVDWLVGKVSKLRVFNDKNGLMNVSVTDIKGEVLVVSQFTLHASTKKGNRPSYIKAAKPDISIPLYEEFVKKLSLRLGSEVKTGVFGEMMDVSLTNDGPVTIFMDSKNKE